MNILAIDPGNIESAYAFIDVETRRPVGTAKVPNDHLRLVLMSKRIGNTQTFIEMVASYGMPVGREVFETVLWTGRFFERASIARPAQLVYRKDVKLHHCHDSRAKDGNIIQALVDRFAPGAKNMGKGTKKDPGWFYGFSGDIWQTYALGVYAIDVLL